MAQNRSNFSTWTSPSGGANLYCEFGMGCNVGSEVIDVLDQPLRQLHHPTQVQIPDTLGSVHSQNDCSEEVLDFESGYNHVSSYAMPNRFPEVSSLDRTNTSVINRTASRTRFLPEEVFPSSDHRVKSPVKIKTGRRRRAAGRGTPDGWVASKNLISERRRREKLQKGLIALRELVPMFNMKMDRVSILTDAIDHLRDLKQTVEKLEGADSNEEDRSLDFKSVEMARSSFTGFGNSESAENETENRKYSSTDGSHCSELFDDSVVPYNYEQNPASRDWNLHRIQLDVTKLEVTKLDQGVYKVDIICIEQSGFFVLLSQAFEAFVIEVVHTSIVVITPTKVTCTFVVKMSSWNDMTLGDVKADIKMLLGKYGLQFLECCHEG